MGCGGRGFEGKFGKVINAGKDEMAFFVNTSCVRSVCIVRRRHVREEEQAVDL